MGAGGLEKQDAFPVTRAIFTQGLKQAVLHLSPPGWELPCKSSSFSQQRPALAEHSLKLKLPNRYANSQKEMGEGPGTAA